MIKKISIEDFKKDVLPEGYYIVHHKGKNKRYSEIGVATAIGTKDIDDTSAIYWGDDLTELEKIFPFND